MWRIFGVIAAWLAGPAAAQEYPRMDLHGQVPPPPSGDPADPLTVWAPSTRETPVWTIGALGEYGLNPVIILTDNYDVRGVYIGTVVKYPVRHVTGANLSARFTPTPRISVALGVPVFPYVTYPNPGAYDAYLAGDPLAVGFGDVRIAAPIGLVVPPAPADPTTDAGRGFALSLIPAVSFTPPGAPPLLAEGGPAARVTLAPGWRNDRLALGAAGGAKIGSEQVAPTLAIRRAMSFYGGAHASVRLAGRWWLGVEATGRLDPAETRDVGGVVVEELPPSGETLMSLRGPASRALTLQAGGGLDVVDGPTAAAFRAFAGAVWVAPRTKPVTGEPDYPWIFQVSDPDGSAVRGARVVSEGIVLATTDPSGTARVDRSLVNWSRGIAVEADLRIGVSVEKPLTGPEVPIAVTLDWRPAVVDATVTDGEGNPVNVELVATPADGGPPVRGRPGELTLPPGTWRVEVVPPAGSGLATQVRELVVPDRGSPPLPLEVVAVEGQGGPAGLALQLVDPDGRPVVGARVSVDGVPIGTTADGGFVAIRGLQPGEHEILVQHEAFTTAIRGVEARLGDLVAEPLPLQRQPGTVRVLARDPTGAPVPDAVVRFVGNSRLAPMSLGSSGERIQVLSPGEWVAVVSSPTWGVQERTVLVSPDRYDLLTVEVVFLPREDGKVRLELLVLDPAGAPVEGAQVQLDNVTVGATSTGGTMSLPDLAPGQRTLRVGGNLLEQREEEIVLQAGIHEHIVTTSYVAGAVDVVVRGPEGPVDDAQVRFVGGTRAAPLRETMELGPDGREQRALSPGTWTVVVTSGRFGAQERRIELAPDDLVLHRVEFVLTEVEGLADLELRLVGPEGEPIGGAAIALDELLLGTTANTGEASFRGFAVGDHTLAVPAFGPYGALEEEIRLSEGDNEVELSLEWAPWAVRVDVKYEGKPVTDAFVRLIGPRRTEPVPVDQRGRTVLVASRALWVALATSPTMGVAEKEFTADRPTLTVVPIVMTPPSAERADLSVVVVDPEGKPIEDAVVTMDGTRLGDAEIDGVVVARNLLPGEVVIEVSAPDHVPSAPLSMALRAGQAETTKVVLGWAGSPVRVRVTDPEGKPAIAEIGFRGPRDVEPQSTSSSGTLTRELSPGEWTVFATAGELAASAKIRVSLAEPATVNLELAPTAAVMAGESVVIRERVEFDFGQATLRDDAGPLLAQVAQVLLAQADIVRVEVQGHTDTVGALDVNTALSQSRAEAVVAALVELGVPREALYARGYGPTRPVAENTTEEGRARNRRVQFEVQERAD